VFSWSDYDEMIELANDVDYGLAAGVITENLTKAHQCAKDIEAGNIWINTYNDFPAGQPFGGYKQSGIGREIGQDAVDHYTQTKTINISLQLSRDSPVLTSRGRVPRPANRHRPRWDGLRRSLGDARATPAGGRLRP